MTMFGPVATFFGLLGMWTWMCFVTWLWRYLRTIINAISHWMYKSIPIPAIPSFTSKDVTVIIPTIHNDFEELRESLLSILACKPYELLLVTTSDKYPRLVRFVKSLEAANIRVFQSAIANKRLQVCEAIPKVKTPFIVMADDDVTWPTTIMPWLLAPFEDKKMGGVGTCQRVKRIKVGPWKIQCWNWLGAAYIERRNFEISATHNIDGGTSCMSGRTGCFRSEILQDPLFLEGFKTERWGEYHLNADDDNFVTRWLVSHCWRTWVQYNKECEVETTLENNLKFLYQCARWARSNWRSNYTSLVTERHVWRQQPWSAYALHVTTFTSLTSLYDPWILFLTWMAASENIPGYEVYAVSIQAAFMFVFIKTVKLWGLWLRDPRDIVFYPVSVAFGYFHHACIKPYALLTWNITSWGSRADGDTNDNHRMSPRARPSESVTLPPGHHPTLVRYTDEKSYVPPEEKYNGNPFDDDYSDNAFETPSDDGHEFGSSSNSSSSDSLDTLSHRR